MLTSWSFFSFSANRWLDEKEGDKKKSIDLMPDSGKAADASKKPAVVPPAPNYKPVPANQRSVSQGPPAAQPSQNKNPAQSQAKPAQNNAKSEANQSKTAPNQSQSKAPATTGKPGAQPAAQPAKQPTASQNNKTTPPANTQKTTAASVIVNSSTNKGASTQSKPAASTTQPAGGKQTQPAATKPAPPQNSKAGPAANGKPAATSQPSTNKSQDTKAKSSSLPPTQNRPQAPPSQPNAKASYKITIKTADELGAGTDAKVSIKLIGTKGNTGDVVLDQKVFTGKKGKNVFEKGNTDEFTIQAADVGQVSYRIRGDLLPKYSTYRSISVSRLLKLSSARTARSSARPGRLTRSKLKPNPTRKRKKLT